MPGALAGPGGVSLSHKLQSLGLGQAQAHYETSSLESVKQFTLSGLGIGLLPYNVAREALQLKTLKPVPLDDFPKEGVGRHRISLIMSKHREPSQTLLGLIDEIQKQDW